MLVLTWLRMQACTLLPWHSLGPCWQVKSQPPSSDSVNCKHFKLKLKHYVFSLCYNSDISFSEGFENNFKFLGSKYLEGGMKLVCHEPRKGKKGKVWSTSTSWSWMPRPPTACCRHTGSRSTRSAWQGRLSVATSSASWLTHGTPSKLQHNKVISRTIFIHLFLYLYLESQNCE